MKGRGQLYNTGYKKGADHFTSKGVGGGGLGDLKKYISCKCISIRKKFLH